MRFVSYLKERDRIGIEYNGKVYDLAKSAEAININLPSRMGKFLKDWNSNLILARKIENAIKKGKIKNCIVKETKAFISGSKSYIVQRWLCFQTAC